MSAVTIHLLRTSGRLEPFVPRISSIVTSTLERVQAVLPIQNVDIVLCDNPTWTIPESGFGGYTPEPHLVQIWFDPTSAVFDTNLERELAPTLAHELHHATRWRDPGYGTTLREAFVTEGLAQSFEMAFRDGETPFYAAPLEGDQMTQMLERARLEFGQAGYNHNAWFFGDAGLSIPRWTGYKLGFQLVSDYLNRTQQTAAQARHVNAETVLNTLEVHT